MLPLEAFAAERDIGIERWRDVIVTLGAASGMSARFTLDGLATFSGQEHEPEGVDDYALLFRSGIIETAATVGHRGDDGWYIPASRVEWAAISTLASYRAKLTEKGVAPPIYVFLSLIGVRHHYLAIKGRAHDRRRNLRNDALLLPEAVITDTQQTEEDVLRPVLDRFWNAFGYEQSPTFNEAGKYVGPRY